MRATASYPGSLGEILQGKFQNKDVLISCPVNFYTCATLFESSCPENKYRYSKSMQFLNAILKKWDYEGCEKNIDIAITSQLPNGKGFASSTADLCATYYALLKLFNKQFNEEELISTCVNIEPTDSIIFDKITVFDYKKGSFKESIGEYFKFNMLVFEGSKVVNTVEFNNKKLEPLREVTDLVEIFKEAIKAKSLKDMALAATESIRRNQNRLKYDILSEVIKIKESTGGLGIAGAHSGDVLAVIYEDSAACQKALRSTTHIHDYKIYKLEAIDKNEIYSCIYNE